MKYCTLAFYNQRTRRGQPITNLILISLVEVKRLFTTRRGLIALLAFALLWALMLRYLIHPSPGWLASDGRGHLLASLLFSGRLNALLRWELPELSVLWLTALYLFPMLTLVLAADQTTSDRLRGTLRVLSLHSNRASLFLGRFTGQLLCQFILVCAALASVTVVIMIRDVALLSTVMKSLPVILCNIMLVILPYTALMALLSLFAKSARQATVLAVIVWIVMTILISWLHSRFAQLPAETGLIIPGAQIPLLLQYNDWQSLRLAFIPIVQTAVLLLIGYGVFSRSDL